MWLGLVLERHRRLHASLKGNPATLLPPSACSDGYQFMPFSFEVIDKEPL